jgi:invasion protein IalB
MDEQQMTNTRRAAPLIALCAMALLLVPMASAQDKEDAKKPEGGTVTTRTTKYDGWTVVCTEEPGKKTQNCSANFRVINSKNQQNLLVWLFGYNAKGERLAEFRTLTEVLIEPGVTVAVGEGDPLRASYVSCGAGGCQATLALDDAAVKRLRAAEEATVSMTRTDGQVIQMKMKVTGIAPAMKAIGF